MYNFTETWGWGWGRGGAIRRTCQASSTPCWLPPHTDAHRHTQTPHHCTPTNQLGPLTSHATPRLAGMCASPDLHRRNSSPSLLLFFHSLHAAERAAASKCFHTFSLLKIKIAKRAGLNQEANFFTQINKREVFFMRTVHACS